MFQLHNYIINISFIYEEYVNKKSHLAVCVHVRVSACVCVCVPSHVVKVVFYCLVLFHGLNFKWPVVLKF